MNIKKQVEALEKLQKTEQIEYLENVVVEREQTIDILDKQYEVLSSALHFASKKERSVLTSTALLFRISDKTDVAIKIYEEFLSVVEDQLHFRWSCIDDEDSRSYKQRKEYFKITYDCTKRK